MVPLELWAGRNQCKLEVFASSISNVVAVGGSGAARSVGDRSKVDDFTRSNSADRCLTARIRFTLIAASRRNGKTIQVGQTAETDHRCGSVAMTAHGTDSTRVAGCSGNSPIGTVTVMAVVTADTGSTGTTSRTTATASTRTTGAGQGSTASTATTVATAATSSTRAASFTVAAMSNATGNTRLNSVKVLFGFRGQFHKLGRD